MKAKDIVMGMAKIEYIRNSTVARDMVDNAKEEGRKAGIKEVVEWVNANFGTVPATWQAKLKEWGIE